MKFFGKCNDVDRAMRQCLKIEVCFFVFFKYKKNTLNIPKRYKLSLNITYMCAGVNFFFFVSLFFYFTETGASGAEQTTCARDEEETERRSEEGALNI